MAKATDIRTEGKKMTKIQYNVQSRKQLADDIGNFLNTVPKYLGVPTCNYQIADCLLDRRGLLTIPDEMERSIVEQLIASLRENEPQSIE